MLGHMDITQTSWLFLCESYIVQPLNLENVVHNMWWNMWLIVDIKDPVIEVTVQSYSIGV